MNNNINNSLRQPRSHAASGPGAFGPAFARIAQALDTLQRSGKIAAVAALMLFASGAYAQSTVTNTASVAPPSGITNTGTSCTGPASTFVSSTSICSAADTDSILPTVTLTKVSNGGVGDFTFTGTNGWTSQTITTVTSGVGEAGATQTLTAASTQTDISETVPAGYRLTGISCSGLASGTATTNLTGAPVSGVPAYSVRLDAAATAAGNQVACTFTNTKLPTVTLTKVSNGGFGAFTFPATGNGWASQTISTTASGVGVAGATQTLTAASTETDISETVPAGYRLTGISCSGLASGTATTNLTGAPVSGVPAYSVRLDAAATAAGNQVACTFTNAKLPTITISKVSNGGVGPFDFTGNRGFVDQTITTVTSGVPAAGATQTLNNVNVVATFSEVLPSGYLLTDISCSGFSSGTATTNLTGVAGTLPAYSVRLNAAAMAPGNNIACTFTNQAVATLQLAKVWSANSIPTNVASIGATTGGTNNTTAFDSTAPNAANSGTAVTVAVGNVITLPAETMSPGTLANYNTVLSCLADGSAMASTLSGTNGQADQTLTINSGDLGKAIVCTYTNTRKTVSLTLAKTWVNAIVTDAVSITATGLTSYAATAASANETDTDTAQTVRAGDVITLAESFTSGSAANYTSSLSCAGNNTGAITLTGPGSNQLTVPADDTAITCGFTNTRKTVSLTLAKTWVNAIVTDAVSITATGLTSYAATADSANETDTDTAQTVRAGDVITLAESFTSGSAANYTSVLICTGNNTGAITLTGPGSNQLTVPADDTAITCGFTNTRKTAALTLQKVWANAIVNDAVTISATGLTDLAAVANSANETDNAATAQTVRAGDVITITETFGVGSAANYTSVLSCTGNNSGAITLTGAGSNELTVPAGDTAITCGFTNTLQIFALTGRVFNDGGANGAGGAVLPNDGIAQAGEVGLASIPVSLTNCGSTVFANAVTNGAGQYVLNVPASLVGSEVCVTTAPQVGQLATGASVGSVATVSGTPITLGSPSVQYTYTRGLNSHIQKFTLPASSLSGLNFGLVGTSTFGANSNLPGVANSTVRHNHQFVAATGGSVTFTVLASIPAPPAAGPWGEKLFRDDNCNGTLDGAEANTQIGGVAIPVDQGDTVCLVMEQFIPAAVPGGGSNEVVVTAKLTLTNSQPTPLLFTTATVTDVTTVGDSAVVVFKQVRNVTTDGTNPPNWGISNQAQPGHVLEYRITYLNNGPSPVTQLVLSDATPVFTTFVSAGEVSPVGASLSNCRKNTPVNPALVDAVACNASQTVDPASNTGVVSWRYDGSLQPGATGAVVFRVVVDAP